jgi:hypothetical protein
VLADAWLEAAWKCSRDITNRQLRSDFPDITSEFELRGLDHFPSDRAKRVVDAFTTATTNHSEEQGRRKADHLDTAQQEHPADRAILELRMFVTLRVGDALICQPCIQFDQARCPLGTKDWSRRLAAHLPLLPS